MYTISGFRRDVHEIALLYSTLPNRTVESQISETYIFLNYIMVVRDCDFL